MRVFVTGATGFIGFAIVKELIAAGHQVVGLARSEASGQKLLAAGAQVQIGDVENLESLRHAASRAEGVIHTAFYHKISHMPLGTRLRVFLGGAPGGIVGRFLSAAVTADRRAIETMAAALPGKGSPLVATFGTLSMPFGVLATEDQSYDRDPSAFGLARARNQDVLEQLAAHGLRTSAIRLAPVVHGPGAYGLASRMIMTARKKKQSAYIGDGSNRWPAVHQLDAARLFRLALEKSPPNGVYHGVAEEGIALRDIAEVLGQRLRVPAVSISRQQAAKYFSFLAPAIAADNPTSSRLTQERLGWKPSQIGLLADLQQSEYIQP
ncbi:MULTISPECIES: SDR family oxidoreductase [Acidobacterium]|uniref:NAD-dependent epimerase/dehydratase family protein n=1 Tax=Acidobacterium capsulatum (strain ATCC 51196 / DSM 11244 / BCRC 80197 / JCM 7670 / NBRC 15755 / NCIMB 13165 / 161) TaxID=240015 RepID=C1F8R3_ACIC5|nr:MULTISPECIES: SDR family oxidoreductase [Acidobacterium]ACO31545.1 NAD-dependent epimerase/dehydratase family protein [Acidobacterium capsulatum ATCC 51196]HCT61566.1 3-beta hydroxysteroid dehydrogenase [Acidobacterium sp.]